MSKNYKEIGYLGNDIESTVKSLLKYKEEGKLICTEFNGVILYSDTVTMDGAYKDITGKTKAELDKAQQDWKEDYDKKEEEHKERIPSLAEEWMGKGRKVLTEDKWEYWDKIVPIRLGDLYHGMELGCCLDIVKVLNNNGILDEAKEVIKSQDHSGMSYGLVCAMVREFCDRGNEFVSYVK
jgi:ribosomal protein S25